MEPDRWLGVEVRHLAALEAVAREGSFGRAAERLGYTQSAISQQIATLERIVGAKLFERPGGPRRVSLTEAGELLLRHAEAIVARLRAAEADIASLLAGEGGALRVGTYQSVGARILPTLMRRFRESWPHVEIQLTEDASDEGLLKLVERGELDVSFAMLPVLDGPFEAVELLRDPYVVLVAADSPLAGRRSVRVGDLEGVRPDREPRLPHDGARGERAAHARRRRGGHVPLRRQRDRAGARRGRRRRRARAAARRRDKR